MSSAGSLSKLLDIYDIDFAFISEHKLRNEHKVFLDSIHRNYHAITLCDSSNTSGSRCGKGGVAIMYKVGCHFSVSPIDICDNNRILGVKIDQRNTRPIYAFSVYMPSVNYSTAEYHECFQCLKNLYDTFSAIGTVLFLGDFNCDIYKRASSDERLKIFASFLETTQLSAVPLEGSFTFRPTCKMLDYVIINKNQRNLIETNKAIDKDICTVSDHLPILTLLKIETISYRISQNANVAWNKCSDEQLASYQ
ncbi:MAG: hypothetical protein AB2693_35355, partial [Candidatus Thiodiazotropha sp.]